MSVAYRVAQNKILHQTICNVSAISGLQGVRVQAGRADGRAGRWASWWPKSSQNRA